MLAYLAVTGHAHAACGDRGAALARRRPERSRSALRRTLSTLRTRARRGRLQQRSRSTSGSISTDAWFDLAEFRRLAGDPDAGVDEPRRGVRAAPRRSARRVRAARQRRVRRLAARGAGARAGASAPALLDRLADALAREGRFDEAVAPPRERLALDPLHEPTHRRLIDLYARAGRRGDALAQYRDCVRVLDRELGVAPLRETTELYNAISGGGAPAAPSRAAPAARPSSCALVGREQRAARGCSTRYAASARRRARR